MTAPPAELLDLERVLDAGAPHLEVSCSSSAGPEPLPVYRVAVGSRSREAPAVGFFGGVHGLERIGSQVVIAWLDSLVARLAWDESLHRDLERVRLVFMPLVNPCGMQRGTRANPAGVDLMRNAPVDAVEPVPFLLGGQRISAGLPWYRGRAGEPLQPESQALCDAVREDLHGRPFSAAIDCHSGFGMRDRLWFPHAHTRAPIAHLAEVHALVELFGRTLRHHPYLVEPQSRQYLAHGDLWDHLVLQAPAGAPFLPLTLEMGSWLWLKKNPRQLFSRTGLFNPLLAHRQERVLRRHFALFEFLLRATLSARTWLPAADEREGHRRAALARWYGPQ